MTNLFYHHKELKECTNEITDAKEERLKSHQEQKLQKEFFSSTGMK
jgi:hypothetical protein